MKSVHLIADGVTKRFSSRLVLQGITLEAHSGTCLGIVGDNGSGKSTLIRILGGVMRPDAGTTMLHIDGVDIPPNSRSRHIGMVAPYLNIYDEFTPLELLTLQSRLRSIVFDANNAADVIGRVGLHARRNDAVRTFSSGLRQRVVIALAVHLPSAVLLLDEPSVTLDGTGRHIVETEIQRYLGTGGIVVLATNDAAERAICHNLIEIPS